MRPTLATTDAARAPWPADEPAAAEADTAARVERWVGLSATMVVMLAGIAALFA